MAKVTVEHFLTRSAAEAAEIEAIRSEKPQWNVKHNSETSSSAPAPWSAGGSDDWEKTDYLRSLVWRELHFVYPDLCEGCKTRGDIAAIERTDNGLTMYYDHCGRYWRCWFSLEAPLLFGAERAVVEVIGDLFPPNTAWRWNNDFFAPVRFE